MSTKYDKFVIRLRLETIEDKIVWHELHKKYHSYISQKPFIGFYFTYEKYKIILCQSQLKNEENHYSLILASSSFSPLKIFDIDLFDDIHQIKSLYGIVRDKTDNFSIWMDDFINEHTGQRSNLYEFKNN
jgi:hypothetical protein